MENINLEVTARDSRGKGESRRLRAKGIIPAVFYGANKSAVPLAVNPKDLMKAIDTGAGENTLITLISSQSKDLNSKVVILKDRQLHPITKELVHVDFYEIAMDKAIEVEVPIVTLGKAKGIEDGGVLQMVRKELVVECLPGRIPEKIEIDVSELEIGDTIHIKDINIPEGVELIYETNFTVINLAAPTKEEEPVAEEAPVEGEAAEAAEGEKPAAGDAPKTDGAKKEEAKPEKKAKEQK